MWPNVDQAGVVRRVRPFFIMEIEQIRKWPIEGIKGVSHFLAGTNYNSSASTRYSRNFGEQRSRSRSGASCEIFTFFLVPELFRWTVSAYLNCHYKSMDIISTLMARVLAMRAPWIRDQINTLFCLTGLWQVSDSGP